MTTLFSKRHGFKWRNTFKSRKAHQVRCFAYRILYTHLDGVSELAEMTIPTFVEITHVVPDYFNKCTIYLF